MERDFELVLVMCVGCVMNCKSLHEYDWYGCVNCCIVCYRSIVSKGRVTTVTVRGLVGIWLNWDDSSKECLHIRYITSLTRFDVGCWWHCCECGQTFNLHQISKLGYFLSRLWLSQEEGESLYVRQSTVCVCAHNLFRPLVSGCLPTVKLKI